MIRNTQASNFPKNTKVEPRQKSSGFYKGNNSLFGSCVTGNEKVWPYEESRKVVNLPPDKNIPEGKPTSQTIEKWALLGCVIGVSIAFRGHSSGQWPCDRNVFLNLATRKRFCL